MTPKNPAMPDPAAWFTRPGRCCLMLLAVLLLGQSVQAEMIYSKSRRFRIPFQFDAAELKRLGTKEVQLYVSRDGGEHWQLNEGVAPETAKFTFEAPEDGVYWFSVKTVAASGLIYPAGPHQAGLNVLVDSTPPQLELQLSEIEPGRVKLIWTAADDNLDVASLKLEFRDGESDVWSVVAVRTQPQGQTTWTIRQGSQLLVRGEVADLPGNVTQSSAQCDLQGPPVRNDRPDVGQPVANEQRPTPQVGANQPVKPAPLSPKLTSSPNADQVPVKDASVGGSAAQSADPAKIADKPAPAIDSQGAVHHKVNTSTFRVGYSLDGLGPSGVRQVDLYITEDRGQKWFHYGHDPDRTSPVEVTVPRDGEYGLCFRVTNGLGRVNIPPQPNEPPEVIVTVDRTPPVAKLLPLEHGQEPEANKVVIAWSAQDQDLAERPIALFFSVAPTGPWEAIQGWQPNNERFLWTVPDSLQQPFYIRLDARDNAGNVTRVYGEQPIVVDRSQPRARVTEIEPLNNASR